MSDRFFSAQAIAGEYAALGGPEAHHLLNVMRASVGQEVTLFDDSGAEFAAVVHTVGRNELRLRILERREIDRELLFPLTLGVSLPKGDRQKWLVEKLTELGVTTLVPLITERGVAQPTDSALERLRRTVVEAAKQCGRNRLMQIASPQSWKEWLSIESNERRFVAHPGGTRIAALDLQAGRPTRIAVGPEGGFTQPEIDLAGAAGWRQVDLGHRILRVETAAVALATLASLPPQ